jgi:ribonuclease Z
MSEVKPRLAVGYHSILVPEMYQDIIDTVRTTYDGPLVIANDLYCWSITKDTIRQREVMAAERVQPPPTSSEYMTAKRSGEAGYSEFISSGKWKGYTPPPLPEK